MQNGQIVEDLMGESEETIKASGPVLDWLIAMVFKIDKAVIRLRNPQNGELDTPRLVALDSTGQACSLKDAATLFCMRDGEVWSPSRDAALLGPMLEVYGKPAYFDPVEAGWSVIMGNARAEGCTMSEAACRAIALAELGPRVLLRENPE